MPACCCPVHEGQAGLVIGDMHGLYVHTHIWIMGPLSTRLGNRVEQFVCGGGAGLWLCSVVVLVATLQAYMQACLECFGKRKCEGSNVSRSLGTAAECAMQSVQWNRLAEGRLAAGRLAADGCAAV